MLTSTKNDFRINLRKYCSIKPGKRSSRKTLPLNYSYFETRKSKKDFPQEINSSIMNINGQQKVHIMYEKTLNLYERNLQFYRLNEEKLVKAIQKQMRQRNYIYKKRIINAMNAKQKIDIKQLINCQKLQQQLEMLNKFLQQLYEKKRIKQILIVNSNMKDEQNLIFQKVGQQQLQAFHQNLQCMWPPSLINDYISQYQNICMKFGAAEPNLKPHIHIRNQIDNSREEIKNYFQTKRAQKSKYFHIENKRYF